MTRRFHRDGSITTDEYLSKIGNIYKFVPKENSSPEEEEDEEEETSETLTNTNTTYNYKQ